MLANLAWWKQDEIKILYVPNSEDFKETIARLGRPNGVYFVGRSVIGKHYIVDSKARLAKRLLRKAEHID